MSGKRMEMPYPPIVERRSNPYGPGIIVRRTVDIDLIASEMANPAAVIAEKAKTTPLVIEPNGQTNGYL